MDVIKVELEGLTASFRYPHFMIGKQPSYPMPPPATIYGHICSAVGEWLEPGALRFAYYFTYEGKGNDYEHIYQVEAGSGKVDRQWGFVKNIELGLVPQLRELFLHPKLILYIDAPDQIERLYKAFHSPRYPVLLGRSQDIAAYKRVDKVKLSKSPWAYFDGTILPWLYRPRIGIGTTVLMPQFIDPDDRRKVIWERYVALNQKVFRIPTDKSEEGRANLMIRYPDDEDIWIDPESAGIKDVKRAVVWNTFTGTGQNVSRIS